MPDGDHARRSISLNRLSLSRIVAQEEQLKVTAALVMDDQKIPMLITDMFGANKAYFLAPSMGEQLQTGKNLGVPEPEEVGLPFGLSQMKQRSPTNLDGKESRTAFNRASLEVDDVSVNCKP